VLIAGGDIRVPPSGVIEVEGPLVLVAGGWIRVAGRVFSQGDVWKTLEGGGVASHARVERLPLALDAPVRNPLRTTLVVGALTQPFSWTARSSAWRSVFAGHEGAGRLSARFLQAFGGESELVVSAPGELATGPVRALIQLELFPGSGEAWDPPRFERLKLEAVPGVRPPARAR
jgi:hypothetical protein